MWKEAIAFSRVKHLALRPGYSFSSHDASFWKESLPDPATADESAGLPVFSPFVY